MNVPLEIAKTLFQVKDSLGKVNAALINNGYPLFWIAAEDIKDNPFNEDYRILANVPPRFVLGWKGWRPGLVLNQVYLIYLPDNVELTWDATKPTEISKRSLI